MGTVDTVLHGREDVGAAPGQEEHLGSLLKGKSR
jgi:hypothetical protein